MDKKTYIDFVVTEDLDPETSKALDVELAQLNSWLEERLVNPASKKISKMMEMHKLPSTVDNRLRPGQVRAMHKKYSGRLGFPRLVLILGFTTGKMVQVCPLSLMDLPMGIGEVKIDSQDERPLKVFSVWNCFEMHCNQFYNTEIKDVLTEEELGRVREGYKKSIFPVADSAGHFLPSEYFCVLHRYQKQEREKFREAQYDGLKLLRRDSEESSN